MTVFVLADLPTMKPATFRLWMYERFSAEYGPWMQTRGFWGGEVMTPESKVECKHEDRQAGWSMLTCKDCGAVNPDAGHWRALGLNLQDRYSTPSSSWFSSVAAFQRFARDGSRSVV